MTKEELAQIRALMKEELAPINQRLDKMDERLDTIEEDLSELRTGVNTLLDWAERTSNTYDFPLPEIAQ